MSNEEEARTVDGRLAGRTRPQETEGLPHTAGRSAFRSADAASGRLKKSPGLGSVQDLTAAWAEAQPASRQAACRRVAAELAKLAGGLTPHDLNELHFAALVSRWRKDYRPSTAWQYTVYLRMLARSIAALTTRPELEKAVPRLRPPRPRTVILTPEQIAALLANAAPWLRVFITLACALGLRHAEALDVRPAGFDPARHVIRFKAKGGEMQEMPTTEEVEAIFSNAPPGDPMTPLVELYRGRPVTHFSVWRGWNNLKRKAGLPDDTIPHDLRRTAAVTGYELTKDLRFVWQLLRHKNLATTARYLEHVDTTNLRAVLQQLWTPKGSVQ